MYSISISTVKYIKGGSDQYQYQYYKVYIKGGSDYYVVLVLQVI